MSNDPSYFIHKRFLRETSLRILFFTRTEGLIEASYRGARKSSTQALLQPFVPLWLQVQTGNYGSYVQKLELLGTPLAFKGKVLFSALYVNELIQRLLKFSDPQPTLFNMYEATLMALSEMDHPKKTEPMLRQFERALLMCCGYGFSFITDREENKIDPNATYHFTPTVGFERSATGLFLGAHLHSIAENQLSDEAVLKSAKYIMRCAIAAQLDTPIQSRFGYLLKNAL
jgi:DNA repair protein RecO (recombination protein O)